MMRWLLGAVLAFACGMAQAAPLDAYGKLPSIEALKISPDGSRLAFVTTVGEERRIFVQTLDGKLLRQLRFGDQKLRDLSWAGSKFLILSLSTTTRAIGVIAPRGEYLMAQVLDVDSGKMQPVKPSEGMTMNIVLKPPEVRVDGGKPMIYFIGILFEGQRGVPALFRQDPAARRSFLVERGTSDTRDWVLGPDGGAVAEMGYDEPAKRWYLKAKKQGGAWKVLLSLQAPLDPPVLVGLGRKTGQVVVGQSKAEAGGWEQRELSLDDATWGEALPPSLGEVIFDPVDHRAIGGSQGGQTLDYLFFDPAAQARWKLITKAFPDAYIRLVSWTDDRNTILLLVSDPIHGVEYFSVDLKSGRAVPFAPLYDGVTPADVSTVKTINYKAADGLNIPAYLTLPRGRPAKNLPLVVLPHGGPAVSDAPGFDWWSQALASRGYAVLQPQFRGSAGLGVKHLAAGYGQWGRAMQTDLSDGVASLAAQGLIDPKRVCIVGASYGGYAALAGVILQKDIYRCAVAVGPVTDLTRFLTWRRNRASQGNDTLQMRYWTRFMGVDGIRDPDLASISPAQQAAQASAPVLLLHGVDDTVTPFEQSRVMAEALTRAGKAVQLTPLKGEDHWLSRGDTRLQMLTETVTFLEANNPPDAAVRPAN